MNNILVNKHKKGIDKQINHLQLVKYHIFRLKVLIKRSICVGDYAEPTYF